jgi:SAM-dependent methyltransferase
MTELFGPPYARQYDTLYGEKDYEAECDAVEALLRQYGTGAVTTMLDLGCGTGTHALLLASRGYAVTGVDRAPAMLERARAKAAQRAKAGTGTAPAFLEGDIRELRLGRTFDAVVMLFAVLGYQAGDDDLAAALRTVREHLRPGGVFICDVWFGPAVLAIGTSERAKTIDVPGGRLHRTSSGRLDTTRHTCRVEFNTWRTTGDRVVERSAEEHIMRYFFPAELDELLSNAGMERCTVRPFDNIEALPGPATWNVWVCARAVAGPG